MTRSNLLIVAIIILIIVGGIYFVYQDRNITWVRAVFPSDYQHAVDIWHPEGWQFVCCGDSDTQSNHVVLSPDESKRIVVTDYGLLSLREGGLDSIVRVTPEERMVEIREQLSQDENVVEMGLANLEALGVQAHIFQTPRGQLYLFRTSTGPVSVTFEDHQTFDDKFITEFLNRLREVL